MSSPAISNNIFSTLIIASSNANTYATYQYTLHMCLRFNTQHQPVQTEPKVFVVQL